MFSFLFHKYKQRSLISDTDVAVGFMSAQDSQNERSDNNLSQAQSYDSSNDENEDEYTNIESKSKR